jgi:hypothetical protein
VTHIAELRHVNKLLVGRPENRSSFWRPRYRCEDNIKVNIEGVGCGTWAGLYLLHYIVLNVMDTEHRIGLTSLAMDLPWCAEKSVDCCRHF